MANLRVQRLLQVLQDGSCGDDTIFQVVYAKALQRLHVEVAIELLVGCLFGEYPVVHLKGTQTGTEVALKVVAVLTIV